MELKIKKIAIFVIIILIFFSSISLDVYSYENNNITDIEKLPFKQELSIAIDTGLEEAKFQPIDLHIDLNHPCWAINETCHSVHVCYDDGSKIYEIESQVYDLEYQDESHIKSCNLVFLIPESANGKEKYFVYYDSSESKTSKYIDHLILEDTHYFYEPIPGQKIDFDHYQIKEDGNVIYAVVQKGTILDNPVALAVAKFKPGSKEVETNNIDQIGIFDMRYGIKKYPYYYGSSWAEKAHKKILIDGNLMVRVKVECISPDNSIKSDNIYTYYYCPTDTKKIHVNVNHEVIQSHEIEDPIAIDGAYAGIVTIKSRSASIEKMNVGEILPSLNIYGEDQSIKNFKLPEDPDSVQTEYILATKDDCDLGERAWVSLSDPSTGRSHGLIFNSNTGLTNGEEDGIQVKSYVIQNIKLPGLEADSGTLLCTRNAYEKDGIQNAVLSEGFTSKFNVEFITIEKGGHNKINSESQIFQTLIKDVPLFVEYSEIIESDVEKYSLTTFIHFAPSIPLGSLLSAASGKTIPYIHAEIYKENSLKSSGSAGRLSLSVVDFNLEDMSLIQKIKFAFRIFDWKNASLFKKIFFPDLETGAYLIKIFKENPLFSEEREFIGFRIIDMKQDESVHIFCTKQGYCELSAFNQNENGIKNVRFLIETDEVVIAEAFSDENGSAILKVPCYPKEPYILKTIYQDFLIDEKKIRFGLRNHYVSKKELFTIENYDLNLILKDTWGLTPGIDLNPTLTSNEMVIKSNINAEKTKNGEYVFSNLYPAKYTLIISYKSFELEKEIIIDKNEALNLVFPAEYKLNFDIMNSYGDFLNDGSVSLSRNQIIEEKSIDENGKISLSVPPGKYFMTVYSNDEVIAKQEIDVSSNKDINIVTSQDSIIHTIVFYFGIILAIFSIIFVIINKRRHDFIKLFVISLLLISIVSPWWILNGDDGTTSTTTKTMLFPPKIVTLSSSTELIGGDVSQVPSEFTMVLNLIMAILAAVCFILLLMVVIKNKFRKTYKFFSIFSIILLIITISIFFYAISQLTDVSVGSVIGNDDLEINLPGLSENKILSCEWGFGIGFYLVFISILILIILNLSFIKNKFLIKMSKKD